MRTNGSLCVAVGPDASLYLLTGLYAFLCIYKRLYGFGKLILDLYASLWILMGP